MNPLNYPPVVFLQAECPRCELTYVVCRDNDGGFFVGDKRGETTPYLISSGVPLCMNTGCRNVELQIGNNVLIQISDGRWLELGEIQHG